MLSLPACRQAYQKKSPHPVCLQKAQAQNASSINPHWILLDFQSTISVFNNVPMLINVHERNHTLRALTNGGHQHSNMIGDFYNLSAVWYKNPASIANIMSAMLPDRTAMCTRVVYLVELFSTRFERSDRARPNGESI